MANAIPGGYLIASGEPTSPRPASLPFSGVELALHPTGKSRIYSEQRMGSRVRAVAVT